MLKAKVPVVSICAVRTGAGKSQTSRRVYGILRKTPVQIRAGNNRIEVNIYKAHEVDRQYKNLTTVLLLNRILPLLLLGRRRRTIHKYFHE